MGKQPLDLKAYRKSYCVSYKEFMKEEERVHTYCQQNRPSLESSHSPIQFST